MTLEIIEVEVDYTASDSQVRISEQYPQRHVIFAVEDWLYSFSPHQ